MFLVVIVALVEGPVIGDLRQDQFEPCFVDSADRAIGDVDLAFRGVTPAKLSQHLLILTSKSGAIPKWNCIGSHSLCRGSKGNLQPGPEVGSPFDGHLAFPLVLDKGAYEPRSEPAALGI